MRTCGHADIKALRVLSTRARITATSFTNHYEWGDFKGNPRQLMEQWFDLHLYLANWGTRRLMVRLPKRLVDGSRFDRFLMGSDLADVIDAGEHLILDICDDGENLDYDNRDDGSGWLGALAPLRTDMLSGDWRLPYLLWLEALGSGNLRDDATWRGRTHAMLACLCMDLYLAHDSWHCGLLKRGCYSGPHRVGIVSAVLFGDEFLVEVPVAAPSLGAFLQEPL